ncbi:unnamed protein product, partial [Polarella glacialis]
DLFEEAFDYLPFACLVEGHVLVLHGGIGKGDWDLNNLRNVRRPINDKALALPQNKWLLNILWSDPIEDDFELTDSEDGSQLACKVSGVHLSPRKDQAVVFGWDVTKTFCARNGLGMVVRSHQCKLEGLGFDVMHDGMLIRIFSARDYEGNGNDSAILSIRKSDLDVPESDQDDLCRTTSLGMVSLGTVNDNETVKLTARVQGFASLNKRA